MQKHDSVDHRRRPEAARKNDRSKKGNDSFSAAIEVAGFLATLKGNGNSKLPSHLPVQCASKEGAPPVSNPSALSLRSGGLDRIPLYSHLYPGAKVVTIVLTAGDVSWNGSLYSLLGSIASGVQDGQRTGDVIRVIGYHLMGRMHIGTYASPGADCEAQVKLVWSMIPGLAVTNFYQDVGTAYSGCSPPDWDWSRAVRTLHHQAMVLDTYRPSKLVSHASRMDQICTYEQNSATPAVGQMYLVGISGEDPAVANTPPRFLGTIQLYYQDV